MEAAGTYLRVLRENRRSSRARIANIVGVSEMSIARIEEGNQEPKAELLAALVQSVEGNIDHIYQLLLSKTATAQQGEQLAQAWLQQKVDVQQNMKSDEARIQELIASAPSSELAEIIEELQAQANADPDVLGLIRGFLAGLRARRPLRSSEDVSPRRSE